MTRVFVLGHRGMLGHVVERHFRDTGFDPLVSERRYTGSPRDPLVEEVRESGAEWIINAIGRIKQKSNDPRDLFRLNAQLPIHLATRISSHQQLLHASTDCVFSGSRGSYSTSDERDADDDYGLSKAIGEAAAKVGRCYVFRVSIIGPERTSAVGLLEWFLRQCGPVKGFVNHRWNGITTLEWSKRAAAFISGSWSSSQSIVQLASPPLSKYDLLKCVGDVFKHNVLVEPINAADTIDRTLLGDIVCPRIDAQLRELYAWYQAQV